MLDSDKLLNFMLLHVCVLYHLKYIFFPRTQFVSALAISTDRPVQVFGR